MRTKVSAVGALSLLIAVCGCGKAVEKKEPLDLRPLVKVGRLLPSHAFVDGVQVQGAVRTKFSASIASRVAGAIDHVMAEEGAMVRVGQPLFQVDKVNLNNRVLLAQEDLKVAGALVKESEAALAEADASFAKAQADAGRMKRLFEDDQAVTKDAWEKADLQFKLASATRERACAAVESARARVGQAETSLSVAQKNLADSLGVAPFDGVIVKKLLDKGDFANVGSAVFEMDDPRVYEVCFSMNAAHYDRVAVGQTRVCFADGGEAVVTYKSPSVHPVTRTFEIRVTVERSRDLAAGMLRDALVVFRRFDAPALPVSAVGLRGGKVVAFVAENAKVSARPVDSGLTWQGFVEVKNAAALEAADIIVEGMLLLNEGESVRVAQ